MMLSRCFHLFLGLAVSLTAAACGSSNSPSTGTGTGTGTGTNVASWDKARVGNTATAWWINAHKGRFLFSVQLKSSYEDDTAGRSLTSSVTQKMAANTTLSSTALSLIPAHGDIAGSWKNDPDSGYTAAGPVVADNLEKVTEWINGSADPFFTDKYKASAFAWANYLENDASKTEPYLFDIRVWQMGSAADAALVYSDLLKNSLYSNVVWTTCSASACP